MTLSIMYAVIVSMTMNDQLSPRMQVRTADAISVSAKSILNLNITTSAFIFFLNFMENICISQISSNASMIAAVGMKYGVLANVWMKLSGSIVR